MATAGNKQLDNLIEQKILEFLGDPDSGLSLNRNLLVTLRRNSQRKQKLTSHSSVLKKYGLR